MLYPLLFCIFAKQLYYFYNNLKPNYVRNKYIIIFTAPFIYYALCPNCGDRFLHNKRWRKLLWTDVSWKTNGKGKTTYKKGDVYEGEYIRGMREGKGTYTFADGEKYRRTMVPESTTMDKEFYYFSNGNRYDGLWYKDYQQGLGTMYYYNGDKYIGNWEHDKRSGQGKYIFSNGAYYDGSWKMI